MEWDKIVLDYKNGEPISSLVRKYNGANIYLKRKYKLAEKYFNENQKQLDGSLLLCENF